MSQRLPGHVTSAYVKMVGSFKSGQRSVFKVIVSVCLLPRWKSDDLVESFHPLNRPHLSDPQLHQIKTKPSLDRRCRLSQVPSSYYS